MTTLFYFLITIIMYSDKSHLEISSGEINGIPCLGSVSYFCPAPDRILSSNSSTICLAAKEAIQIRESMPLCNEIRLVPEYTQPEIIIE